ncbi:unnamed protein product, partial [Laminaria digitata]
LLTSLVDHDLLRWFRTPVDVTMYTGYVQVVTRDKLIDLGTMLLKSKSQYQLERVAALFYIDIDRIWHNCRLYAKCNRQG